MTTFFKNFMSIREMKSQAKSEGLEEFRSKERKVVRGIVKEKYDFFRLVNGKWERETGIWI